MTPELYKLLHVVGALLVCLGLGAVLATGGKDSKPSAFGMALHGIGLLAMLVAGVGFAHKSGLGFPNWMWAKVGAWVLLGAMPVLVKRGLVPKFFAWLLVMALVGFGAWMGLAQPKPF